MKQLIRNLLVLISALIILLAGLFLPSLILNRVMNSKVDDIKYVNADEILPYDDVFFKMRTTLMGLRETFHAIYDVDEEAILIDYGESIYFEYESAPAEYQNQYNVGLSQLLKFISKWQPDYYDDFLPSELTVRTLIIDKGYTLGIATMQNEALNREGSIIFDTATGIPVAVELRIPYANSIRLENMWRTYVSTMSDTTNMEFTRRAGLIPQYAGYSVISRAVNYDESVVIDGESYYDDGSFVIHFYLE